MFSLVNTILSRDRQTDRRTDRRKDILPQHIVRAYAERHAVKTDLCYRRRDIRPVRKTRGQSNLTKSASRGPIPRLGVTQGVESCTIEFLG